eukprot:880999-Prorocentrum_minimum.AAC.1
MFTSDDVSDDVSDVSDDDVSDDGCGVLLKAAITRDMGKDPDDSDIESTSSGTWDTRSRATSEGGASGFAALSAPDDDSLPSSRRTSFSRCPIINMFYRS